MGNERLSFGRLFFVDNNGKKNVRERWGLNAYGESRSCVLNVICIAFACGFVIWFFVVRCDVCT